MSETTHLTLQALCAHCNKPMYFKLDIDELKRIQSIKVLCDKRSCYNERVMKWTLLPVANKYIIPCYTERINFSTVFNLHKNLFYVIYYVWKSTQFDDVKKKTNMYANLISPSFITNIMKIMESLEENYDSDYFTQEVNPVLLDMRNRYNKVTGDHFRIMSQLGTVLKIKYNIDVTFESSATDDDMSKEIADNYPTDTVLRKLLYFKK